MWTYRTIQKKIEEILAAGWRESDPGHGPDGWQDEDPAAESALLIRAMEDLSLTEYLLRMQEPVADERAGELILAAEKRAARVPLQYLSRRADFYGRTFYVDEHVLIPRFDTETVVRETLRCLRPGMRVLDLCTGSGCIAVTLKLECPEARVAASDISPDALDAARKNAALHHADVVFLQSDLFRDIDGLFDVIVSNPPYIREADIPALQPEVRLHEPHLALSGGEDGLLIYRKLIPEAASHLVPGGRLYLETGMDQAADVENLLLQAGFRDIYVCKDLAGRDRVLGACLCKAG